MLRRSWSVTVSVLLQVFQYSLLYRRQRSKLAWVVDRISRHIFGQLSHSIELPPEKCHVLDVEIVGRSHQRHECPPRRELFQGDFASVVGQEEEPAQGR